MRSKRFDFVEYDKESKIHSDTAKDLIVSLESLIDAFPNGRAKALALTHLEECFMWIGKAIRDEQYARTEQGEL